LVLIDDVLNSGTTLIYGVKHFLEVPLKKFKTAVLVDRNHKKYPVKADFKGISLALHCKNMFKLFLKKQELCLFKLKSIVFLTISSIDLSSVVTMVCCLIVIKTSFKKMLSYKIFHFVFTFWQLKVFASFSVQSVYKVSIDFEIKETNILLFLKIHDYSK
jgi:hypothetical protein